MGALEGRRVAVTRAAHQAADLVEQLQAKGAETVVLSAIELVDPSDGGTGLRQAFSDLHEYDWLVVTSQNTVARIAEFSEMIASQQNLKICAIGPATAEDLQRLGLTVDLVPTQFVAEAIIEAFPSGTGKVLLPRAAVARQILPEGLHNKGWNVDVVEAYKTLPVSHDSSVMAKLGECDAVTFTASSTVHGLMQSVSKEQLPQVVACIGPITAATARELGLDVAVVAPEHTTKGLVAALEAYFEAA